MPLTFEWNENKAISNEKKHGVSFAEATTIYGDSDALTIPDPKHSKDEEIKITIGESYKGRILIAVHTERGDNIRIISTRPASKKERMKYYERKERE